MIKYFHNLYFNNFKKKRNWNSFLVDSTFIRKKGNSNYEKHAYLFAYYITSRESQTRVRKMWKSYVYLHILYHHQMRASTYNSRSLTWNAFLYRKILIPGLTKLIKHFAKVILANEIKTTFK